MNRIEDEMAKATKAKDIKLLRAAQTSVLNAVRVLNGYADMLYEEVDSFN